LEVPHDEGNMSERIESLLNIVRQGFGIGCLGVGLAKHSPLVVIPPGVFLVGRDVFSKLIHQTVAHKTDIPLEMM